MAAKERRDRKEWLGNAREWSYPWGVDSTELHTLIRSPIMKTIFELCDVVRETAYAIHTFHGHGYLEKVYENALAHRLRKLGHEVHQQYPIKVHDEDGTVIGDYYADLIIDQRLVVELKAAKNLATEHIAQTLGYLKASRMEHGLLINFGSFKFEIKKLAMSEATRNKLLNPGPQ